jgi:hypothetical protein
MLLDYIFLDEDERNKFIKSRHEYLIEQISYLSPIYLNQSNILNGYTINVNFENCIKDIYWFCQLDTNLDQNDYANYTSDISTYNDILNCLDNIILFKSNETINKIINDAYNRIYKIYGPIDINNINRSWFLITEIDSITNILKNTYEYQTKHPITDVNISINGKTLLNRDIKYVNTVIPYQKYNNNPNNGLNVYSFSLNPSEDQPSGSLNFSMIKNNEFKINLTFDKNLSNKMGIIKVIGRNYNILRIFSGLGACVYNNF